MDVNYSKESVDMDCTSNVQFEIIPPDVSDIPLPGDISEIPLPSSESVPAASEEDVVDPVIPFHVKEKTTGEIALEENIITKEVSDDGIVKLEIGLNDSVDQLVEETLIKNDPESKIETAVVITEELPNVEGEIKITNVENVELSLQETVDQSASHENGLELSSKQQDSTSEITQFQVIPPNTESIQDVLAKNIVIVTEANEQNVSDAIVNVVVTMENQQNFVEYVVTTSSGNGKMIIDQSNTEKLIEYVGTEPEIMENIQETIAHCEDKTPQVSTQEESAEKMIIDDLKTEKSNKDQENFVEYIEDESIKVESSQGDVQFVVTTSASEITPNASFVEYVDESKNTNTEEESAVEGNVQYVVAGETENDISDEQNLVEYVESEENNKEEINEESVVQYVVSEASNEDASQQNYVQYVVSDTSGEKISGSGENQPGYIQYVVSQGANQENIVQYVVTSSANDKELIAHEDPENFVGYIVAEGDEKQATENSEVTYEVIDESSQSQSEVVIEEMEVDEIPENSNSEQNEDIQIYVIEEDNMQTVIEVHVENEEDLTDKNAKGVPDLVPLESKAESSNKKRVSMGNYIEVVDAKGDTTAKLPCHVLGRNLKNPEADVLSNGRNPPKARPGVKVPPMSLTSCIVTTEEIGDEIDKKLKAEISSYDKPKGGDLLFKHKITKRLAEKLCTSPAQSPSPAKPATQQKIKNSPNTRLAKKNSSQPKPKLDNADLLAILEGDDDPDWSELKAIDQKDQSPPILQAIEKSIRSGHSGKSPPPVLEAQQKPRSQPSGARAPLKLDSEEKRRLAKHQLMNLPHVPNICSSRPRGRPKLTDYNPLKQTLLKNAGMAVYTTPRSKDPPKTYSNRKANDLIKNLVSDWDEESHDGIKNVPTPEETKPVVKTAKVVDTPVSKPQPQTETKTPAKLVTPVASTSSATNIKTSPNAGAKRKNTPPTSQAQIGIVPNKIARIIKKKIIWDPDNPQASYSLSPSVNGAKTQKKDVVSPKTTPEATPTAPKKPLISTPHPKKQVDKPAMQEVHIVIETAPSPEAIATTSSDKADNEKEITLTEKKLKSIHGTAKSSKVIRKLPHKHMFAKRRLMQKTMNRDQSLPLLKKKKKLTEIDRLLMDEGAVNMIYAVERSNNNAEVPEIVTKPNKRLLISLEKERRNLLSKANIIKQAVLRHSTSPGASSRNAKPLRFKNSAAGVRKTGAMRKKSVASNRTSLQSPSLDENPDFTFTEVNESRIIRRHSSSSYSSTCTSPRRLSVDLETKSETNIEESVKPDESESELAKPLKKRQKGVPIFTRPPGADKTYKGKTKPSTSESLMEVETTEESVDKEEENTNKAMNTRSNKKISKTTTEVKKTKQDDITTQKDISMCLQEAHVALTEITVTSEPSKSAEDTVETEENKKDTPKHSSNSKKIRKSPAVEVEKVHNLRQQGNNYKEISIRRHDHLVQIILTPTSTKFKNALNLQTLKELKDVLLLMSKDTSCHVLLLTSSGNIFCHGLDYSGLLQNTADKRRQVVQEMVHAVIELLRILAAFPKILVAGVHGAAIGLGATMLPLFDLVLASDKATFSVPATKHGYIPEGTSLMPWHRLLGHTVINELVLACRELTASEALQYGLVTRTLWPDKFHSDLIPTVKTLTTHSTKAMVATKAMLRQQLLNGLDEALEMEEKQLIQMWTSQECQESFKAALAEWE